MLVPLAPNERLPLDSVSDPFTDNGPFRVLTVVDDNTCGPAFVAPIFS